VTDARPTRYGGSSKSEAFVEPAVQAGRYSGAIVLADISGYTSFLDSVRVAHQEDAFVDGQIPDAYALMSSLLDGIASNIDPPLALVKFEGDAVFAVAPGDVAPHRVAMLECVRSCYRDFRARLDEAATVWTYTCDACARKDSLDLPVTDTDAMTEPIDGMQPIGVRVIPLHE